MTFYNTKRGTVINLDNVEKVTMMVIEDGFELIFNFISGKSHTLVFRDEEICRKEYREILLIMSKEVK